MRNINLITLIFFFLCLNKISLAEKISIVYTIDNDPITNLEIRNEITYLKLFNEKIREMDDEALVIYASKSVIREKIKKIEVSKNFKLGVNEEIVGEQLNQFIVKLGLSDRNEYFDLLKKLKLTNDFIKNKIETELLWNNLIYKKYNSKLNINKEKIEKELKVRIDNIDNKIEEVKLYEILFSANSEIELEKEKGKIKKSINEIGFENTARIFSISNSAGIGGEIGWIKKNQLSYEILQKIENLNKNEVSEIINVQTGKLILLVKDRRFVEKQISFDEELKKAINNEMNKQLNQYSIIYFKKIELNSEINEN